MRLSRDATMPHTINKNNEIMAFCEISDVTSTCEMIVFPKTYSFYKHMIVSDKPLVITGRVSTKDENEKQILCEKIEYIDDYVNFSSLYIKVDSISSPLLNKALEIVKKHKGNSFLYIYCNDTKKIMKSTKYSCLISDDLMSELKDILGDENVVKK